MSHELNEETRKEGVDVEKLMPKLRNAKENFDKAKENGTNEELNQSNKELERVTTQHTSTFAISNPNSSLQKDESSKNGIIRHNNAGYKNGFRSRKY
jgi:hypothetical protein